MNGSPQAAAGDGASQGLDWQQALQELENSLRDASVAAALLKRSLERSGLGAGPAGAASQDVAPPAPSPTAQEDDTGARDAFDRLWDRIDQARDEVQQEIPPEPAPAGQGLELLPRQYLMTVEDREGEVDLVPLHRALAGLAEMGDVSLVSFTNGVPIISLTLEGEPDLERLGDAVAAALDRPCEVIPHDSGRLCLRLKERRDGGA